MQSTILKQSDIIADLHTHTIFSKHGWSTAKENLDAAAQRDIKYMAITDHFYCPSDKIEKKNEIVRILYAENNINHESVRVVNGAEFNLNQILEGIDASKVKNVHWKLFGFHTWFLNPSKIDIKDVPDYFSKNIVCTNISTQTETAYNSIPPTAFAHIEREIYKCENANQKTMEECLAAIVDIAIANNIILEVNESSIRYNECDAIERMKFWINYAKDRNCLFSLGSDSHYCNYVGKFPLSIELLNSLNVSSERIVNTKYSEPILKKIIQFN